MERILIIGSPGTGKSTFAKQLSIKTELPLIHIDYYYHDPKKHYHTDKEAWRKLVMDMAAQDRWIMDGNYGNTMGERMVLADTIFYFDMPRRTALWGVVKRRMSRAKRTEMPAGWKEHASLGFLKYVWGFRKAYAAGTRQLLEQNKDKRIVVFSNHKQVKSYLEMLS